MKFFFLITSVPDHGGLHCLSFHLHLLGTILHSKTKLPFYNNKGNYLGVQFSRIFCGYQNLGLTKLPSSPIPVLHNPETTCHATLHEMEVHITCGYLHLHFM